MKTIQCSEIWGGISSEDNDVCTKGIQASLFSRAFDGGSGGDIYYFSVCAKDLITKIAIADVAGHGSQVSDVSQWLYRSLESKMNELKGCGILEELNAAVFGEGTRGITTASVFTFNVQAATFSFTSAGHPPFFVKIKGESNWKKLDLQTTTPTGNIPLGTLGDVQFDEESMGVDSGDRFFFFTDGLTEASNDKGEAFGENRLLEVLDGSAGDSLVELKNSVIGALEDHMNGLQVEDDLTFMFAEVA